MTYLLRYFSCGWLCLRCHQTDSSEASSVQPHQPPPLLHRHTLGINTGILNRLRYAAFYTLCTVSLKLCFTFEITGIRLKIVGGT